MKINIIYLILILLIFVSNDTVLFGTSGNQTLSLIAQIIYLGISIYLIKQSKKHVKLPFLFLISMLLLLTLTIFINQDFTLGYLIQINSLVTGYLISRNLNFEMFSIYYTKLMCYVALISIFLFSIFTIFPQFLFLLPVQYNIAEVPYINLFFYVHFLDVFRNTSIFREPGVYMIYLNIAIILELFVKKHTDKKAMLIFIIAMFTTLSAAGFVILGLIGLLFFLQEKKSNIKFRGILLLLIIGYVIINNFTLFENTFSKFDSSSKEYSSSLARISSIEIPFAIFLDNPLFGTGLSNYVTLYEKYSLQLYGRVYKTGGHSTNTFFNSLASYGFLYFVILIFLIKKTSQLFSKSIFFNVIVFIIIATLFSNEDLRYSLLFSTLLFYGINRFVTSKAVITK